MLQNHSRGELENHVPSSGADCILLPKQELGRNKINNWHFAEMIPLFPNNRITNEIGNNIAPDFRENFEIRFDKFERTGHC